MQFTISIHNINSILNIRQASVQFEDFSNSFSVLFTLCGFRVHFLICMPSIRYPRIFVRARPFNKLAFFLLSFPFVPDSLVNRLNVAYVAFLFLPGGCLL